MTAFLTGSQEFGYAKLDSDIDLVIQVNVPYIERDEAGTPINKLPQKRKAKQ